MTDNGICTPESAMSKNGRKLTQEGIDLIKSSESCVLEAYADPASPLAQEMRKPKTKRAIGWEGFSGEPWTIGWGSTGLDYFNLDANGKPTKIAKGLKWTQAQADERKKQDLEKFCQQVDQLVTSKITDNAFSALVSFAYNCGISNLKSSTLLKKVNEGKMAEAADEFLKWTKAQGKVLPGLIIRRQKERELFLKP